MNRTSMFGVSKVDDGDYAEVMNQFDMLNLYTKENVTDITDLKKSIALLREREQCLIEQEVKCNHELKELEEQQNNLHQEAELLKERVKSLKLEELKLKDECKIAERRKQPSLKDMQTLEKQKKKLKLYKNLIGLKWNYTAPEGHCVGYVFNNATNGLKPFDFNDMKSVEKIWSEVKAIAKPDWENIK